MNKYLLGIIVFLILISTNKLSYILGCNINKLLDNVYLTEFFTIAVIYYCIKIFGDKNIKSHLSQSIILYVLLKFFTKMNSTFTIISLIIIGIILIENMLKDKNELVDDEDISDNLLLENKEKILVMIVVIGFIYNISIKYKQFGKKFNILEFFFSKKCNNLIYT
tara:strand:+ start:21 stop:515 length:495 start_codon:yes stop_codon:yes gene_type:complete